MRRQPTLVRWQTVAPPDRPASLIFCLSASHAAWPTSGAQQVGPRHRKTWRVDWARPIFLATAASASVGSGMGDSGYPRDSLRSSRGLGAELLFYRRAARRVMRATSAKISTVEVNAITHTQSIGVSGSTLNT